MNKLVVISLIIVGLVVISYCCEDEESTKTDQSDTKIEENLKAIEEADQAKEATEKINQKIKTFDLTYSEFIQRYNESMKTLKFKYKIKIDQKKDNGELEIIQTATGNENFSITLSAENKKGKLTNVTFVGIAQNTSAAADIIIAMVAVVMAFENPSMPADDRPQVLKDIGITDERFSTNSTFKITRNDVVYVTKNTEGMGLWFFATPE